MRRLLLIPVLLAAVTCVALIPASEASAKAPSPAITMLTGSSAGAIGSFCSFNVVVTYSPIAKHPETVAWSIRNAADNSSVGGIVPVALGPSPFSPTGLSVLGGLPAGSYYFDVQLLAKGSVRSEQRTGTFTTTGTCPTAGLLATFP